MNIAAVYGVFSGVVPLMLHRVILFLLFGLLPTSLVRAAPAQQLFNDWQVTCNNQNFCVARNVGLHHGFGHDPHPQRRGGYQRQPAH